MAKSWIAIEEHADEVQDVELMEVPSESLESDLVEVTGLDKDVESLVADGEELEHDQEQVEALADNAEASLEEDGMDETAARATEIAAESFCEKWGIQRKKVGLESFGSSDSRRHATQIAVESLKESAIQMWETFIKWLNEMIAKGRDLLSKLTNAGKSLKKRAEKLEARLEKGLGAQEKKELEGSFSKMLVIDEKVDYQACLSMATTAEASVSSLSTAVAAVVDEAGKVVRGATTPENLGEMLGGRTTITGKFGNKASKKLSAPQGATDLNVSALPANCYLMSYKDQQGNGVLKFEVATEKAKDSKLPTLSADQCQAGVKALYAVGNTLETRLKGFEEANKKLQTLVDAVNEAKKGLREADSEKKADARKALGAARAAVNGAKATERAVTSTLKNLGSGISGYVEASIKAYKKAA